MRSKNIIISSLSVIIGIIVGYIVFGNREEEAPVEHEMQIWTCSMHPQIRQNEPGDCPICGMELILLGADSTKSAIIIKMSEDAIKLGHIQTTIIGSKEGKSSGLRLSGKIVADESTSANLVTHIPGRIEHLAITFTGETVYKGQKIASIYSPVLITAQKELLEAYKLRDEQPSLYEAARNKFKYWKFTDDQIDEIISSKKIRENFNIYADFGGIVQRRKVSVGDHLNQGGILFEIQNLNKLWVVFDVYEKDLPAVKLGSHIDFSTESVPGEKFSAEVSFIDPVINPNTRTAKVRVEIMNTGNLLKPEMFVSGELKTEFQSDMSVTVPKTAVLWTGKRSVVYVKVPELSVPSFEFREVLIGESLGHEYQILDGLQAGEEVVTHGAFVIDASAQLNNQASMMNRLIPGALKEGYLPDFTEKTPAEFKLQLETLAQEYLKLKDALIMSDVSLAKTEALSVKEVVQKIDMSLLTGEAHQFWMKQFKLMNVNAGHISNEDSIKRQREFFAAISEGLVNSLKSFGVTEDKYYEDFCPMANDKNGAYWISEEADIRNPYFGERMMGCGEVINVIDPSFKNKKPVNQSSGPPAAHNH